MRLFFYGTLMDRDVLSLVLERPVAATPLVPATLRGYRRARASGVSYPIVLRDRAATVDGVVVDRLLDPDVAKLSAYEGAGYRLVRATADVAGAGPRGVQIFVPAPGAFTPVAGEWSLEDWRAKDKDAFLARLRRRPEAR
ncbi:MAG: gamma-glutamylcyclotransferase [Rhodospirillales bacterium]|nr:MAG: gamma-glutamylcyclotransferase [Rhodospirillales bacterium]